MGYSLHPNVQRMAATGLTAPMIEKIQSVIANDPRVERIILFGSRAKGTFREGSDIGTRDAAKWREELEEQLFPWSVDVVPITTQTEPAILDHIRRVGISVLERPAED